MILVETPVLCETVVLYNFKLVSPIFYPIFIFSPNDSPPKTMEVFFISS